MTEPELALRSEPSPGAGAVPLDAAAFAPDPIRQFQDWLQAAVAARVPQPGAMTLATADAAGRPSARTVLLKGIEPDGFVLFTNLQSRKGRELAANPYAAVVFRWLEQHRQVTATGSVVRLGDADSDAYFATRPRGSQLSAWASEQSEVIGDRATLEAARAEAERRFAGGDVPRPPYWGGLKLVAAEVEFWQGLPDRLHDRLRYRAAGGGWVLERLSP